MLKKLKLFDTAAISYFRSGYEPIGTSSGGGLVPPLPWEIEEDAVQPFKDEVRLIEVPHTESTKTCHRCRGTGKIIVIIIRQKSTLAVPKYNSPNFGNF
jgi:hypothetical protein